MSTPRYLLSLAIAAVIVGAAAWWIGAPSGRGWHDANLHAVDGIWITGEDPCDPTSSDDRCRAAQAVAIDQVRAADRSSATSVAIARLPRDWVNDLGEHILTTTSGISKTIVAIVDLADGRRVAVGMRCDPTIDGNPARPATCVVVPDLLDSYRVDGSGFAP